MKRIGEVHVNVKSVTLTTVQVLQMNSRCIKRNYWSSGERPLSILFRFSSAKQVSKPVQVNVTLTRPRIKQDLAICGEQRKTSSWVFKIYTRTWQEERDQDRRETGERSQKIESGISACPLERCQVRLSCRFHSRWRYLFFLISLLASWNEWAFHKTGKEKLVFNVYFRSWNILDTFLFRCCGIFTFQFKETETFDVIV